MLKTIMQTAWTTARNASAKFGGRPAQYISEALRQAWQSARRPMQTSFRTAKGSEITIKIITSRVNNIPDQDGDTYTKDVWEIEISGPNGLRGIKIIDNHPQYGLAVDFGWTNFVHNIAPVPADAADQVRAVWDTYTAERDRRFAAAMAEDRKYDEGRAAMRRVMGY